jgi:2-dehydropantoate 2-reductase
MEQNTMKIVIVGAGSIGRLFGGMLGRGGHEVVFLEKDPQVVSDVNEKGIQFIELSDNGSDTYLTAEVRATTEPGTLEVCDCIILAVKGYTTAAATRSIAHLINDQTPILTIQTGLGNIETMRKITSMRNILGGVTYHGATSLHGARVRHAGSGQTLIGELNGDVTERAERLTEALNSCGIQTKLSENIEGHIWAKALIYSAINPLTAILRLKNGQLVEKMESIALAKRLIDEGKVVAHELAVQLPEQDLYDRLLEVCSRTAQNLSPMLQDILNNRATEIDAFNGAIYSMGKLKGVAAPAHQTMTELIRLLEKWGSGRDFGG